MTATVICWIDQALNLVETGTRSGQVLHNTCTFKGKHRMHPAYSSSSNVCLDNKTYASMYFYWTKQQHIVSLRCFQVYIKQVKCLPCYHKNSCVIVSRTSQKVVVFIRIYNFANVEMYRNGDLHREDPLLAICHASCCNVCHRLLRRTSLCEFLTGK